MPQLKRKYNSEARRNFLVSFQLSVILHRELAAQSPATYLETASFQIFREDHDLGRGDADSNERVDVLMAQLTCLANE